MKVNYLEDSWLSIIFLKTIDCAFASSNALWVGDRCSRPRLFLISSIPIECHLALIFPIHTDFMSIPDTPNGFKLIYL
jgi:hypothetical protein